MSYEQFKTAREVANEAVAAERERCAKIAEAAARMQEDEVMLQFALDIALEIRDPSREP